MANETETTCPRCGVTDLEENSCGLWCKCGAHVRGLSQMTLSALSFETKAEILETACEDMERVMKFCKEHNDADPFGALISVIARAIDRGYELGDIHRAAMEAT